MRPRVARTLALGAAAFALAALAPAAGTDAGTAAAQVVGRLPENAVMRDLFDGQRIGPFAGWLTTGLDPVGVRAKSAPIAGVRYTVLLGSPIYFSTRLFGVATEHDVFIPNAPDDARRAGTEPSKYIGLDAGFEISLTGERSWRGLQPLVNFGLGFVVGAGNQFDAGGYSPGGSALYTYGLAARFPTGRNGELRADVGWLVHQMRYPSAFRTTFVGDGTPLRPTGSMTPLTSNRAMTLSWTWGIFR